MVDTNSNVNPFSMPPEAEFFWLHHQEERRSDSESRNAPVWAKSTSASRNGATKGLREEDLPMVKVPPMKNKALDEKPDDHFLTTIATRPAIGLLEPLRENEKDIRSYVSKKRDVFLVQMALDVKKSEVVRLDEKAREKEDALTKSQQILDEDTRKFEEFLQKRYAQAQETMKNAEAQAKVKQEKIAQRKQLQRDIASVHSETAKLAEVRAEYMRYKIFVEGLTPTEWRDQQKALKLARKVRRREDWIAENMKSVNARIAEDERAQERAAEEHEESKKKAGGRKPRKQEIEDEKVRLEKERAARRRRFQKRREEEERRIAATYVEVSSGEESELYFKEPHQLMEIFTELEEKNLFLIQESQETEQTLDETQLKFEKMKSDLEAKVTQLKDNIKQLDRNINLEKKRGEELQCSYQEKANMQEQEEKLTALFAKVQDVYLRCGLSMDHDPDTLQMLGSIEAKLEEMIHGLEEAYLRDSKKVKNLELYLQKDRRERIREQKRFDLLAKQEERLKISLQRSQNPVFKKAGKQVMYRSPPLRQEKREVRDTSEDEANLKDHRIFDMFIDRKGMPQTEAPVIEDPRKMLSSRVLAARAAAAGGDKNLGESTTLDAEEGHLAADVTQVDGVAAGVSGGV